MLAKKQLESDIEPPLKKKASAIVVPDDLQVNIPEQWLLDNNIALTVDDKTIIVAGEELTDKHIDFSTSLIKKDHKNSYIGSPVYTYSCFAYKETYGL